jgi:hypothetical protein
VCGGHSRAVCRDYNSAPVSLRAIVVFVAQSIRPLRLSIFVAGL